MLSDEEKKAIKELTEIKELVEEDLRYKDYEATAILDQIDLESLIIVLNLIEKQQKEIDRLQNIKRKDIQDLINNEKENIYKNYISKDKIKAKIEEYDDKGMTINLASRSAGKTFQQAVKNEVRKVLESLLEKE